MPALDLSAAEKKIADAKLKLDQAKAALDLIQSSQEYDRINLAKKPLVAQVKKVSRQFKDATEELQTNVDELKANYSKFYKQRTLRTKAKKELVNLKELDEKWNSLITAKTQKETDINAEIREKKAQAKVHIDAGSDAEAIPFTTEATRLEGILPSIQAGIAAARTNRIKITANIDSEQIKLDAAKTALDALKTAQPSEAAEFDEKTRQVKALRARYDELKSQIDALNTDIAKYDNELNILTKPASDLVAEKEVEYREAERVIGIVSEEIKKSRLHRIYNYALAESLFADDGIDFEITDKDIDSINLYLHTQKQADLSHNAQRLNSSHFTSPQVVKTRDLNKVLLAKIYSSYDFKYGAGGNFISKPRRLFYAHLARNNLDTNYLNTHPVFSKDVKNKLHKPATDLATFKLEMVGFLPKDAGGDEINFSEHDFKLFQETLTNYLTATQRLYDEEVNSVEPSIYKDIAEVQKKTNKLIVKFEEIEETGLSTALDPRLHRASWMTASQLQPYYEKIDAACKRHEETLNKVILTLEKNLASHPGAHQTSIYMSKGYGSIKNEDFVIELRKERLINENKLKEAKETLASIKAVQLKLHGDNKAKKGSKEALGLLGQCELAQQKVGVTLSQSKMKSKDYDNIEHYTATHSYDIAPHKPKVLKLGSADKNLPISADKPIPKGKIRGFSKTYENPDGSSPEPGSFVFFPSENYKSITYNKTGNGFEKGDKAYVAVGDERIEFHKIPPISTIDTIPSSTMQFMMDAAIKYYTNGAELQETSFSKLKPFQRHVSITGGSPQEQEALYIATMLLKKVLGHSIKDIVVDPASTFKPSSLITLGWESSKIKAFRNDPAVKAKLDEVQMWKNTQKKYLNKNTLNTVKKLETSSVLAEPARTSPSP